MSESTTAAAAGQNSSLLIRGAEPADHAAIRGVVLGAYAQYAGLLAPDVFSSYLAAQLDLGTHASYGRLLVAGGHLADSHGLNQATIYDSVANTWTPTAAMIHGRWYPTAITLPTGGILVLSGSFFDLTQTPSVANNVLPQVWSNGNFTNVTPIPDAACACQFTN